jgi:hypothetical protein
MAPRRLTIDRKKRSITSLLVQSSGKAAAKGEMWWV